MRTILSALVVLLPLLAATRTGAEEEADASVRFFRQYDADDDGRLSHAEWPAFLEPFFREVDANGDGFVDRREDRRYRAQAARPEPRLAEPTHANLRYGPHARNVVDLWLADSEAPTPLVVYFHGGGFRAGDKRTLPPELLAGLLARGVSVAAANYRLTDTASFPAPMHDAARAVQFLRHHAETYGIAPARVGATGGSAGAGISLWLAFHADLADPASEDPIERESSRLSCAAVYAGQSSYDPRVIRKLFDTTKLHPALAPFYGMAGPEEVDDPRFFPLYEEASPITHLTADDPPVFLFYPQANEPLPPDSSGQQHIHHPIFGFHLNEKARAVGVSCTLRLREDVGGRMPIDEIVAFFGENLGVRPPAAR